MTKFYIIRHGQTDYNKNGKIQGRLDIPLNDTGVEQAEQMSEQLKNLKFDTINYSPLARAKQTAEAVLKNHPESEFIETPGIIERDFGSYEGKPAKTDPPYYGLWNLNTEAENLKDAESIADIRTRVYPFLDRLAREGDKTFCLVCHGGVALVIQEYFEGTPGDGNLLGFSVLPHGQAAVFEK